MRDRFPGSWLPQLVSRLSVRSPRSGTYYLKDIYLGLLDCLPGEGQGIEHFFLGWRGFQFWSDITELVLFAVNPSCKRDILLAASAVIRCHWLWAFSGPVGPFASGLPRGSDIGPDTPEPGRI